MVSHSIRTYRALLLIALAACSRAVFGQTMRLTVTGVVRTSADSSPLEGVTVSFPAVKASTRSHATGRFRLEDIPATRAGSGQHADAAQNQQTFCVVSATLRAVDPRHPRSPRKRSPPRDARLIKLRCLCTRRSR
jgi:hypothetical protein